MFRGYAGRLLIVAAGGGCLAALIFVALPMMDEPAPSTTRHEIAAEAPGADEWQGDEGELEAVTPVPSPLVGRRNDGEEVAVIFPASEPETEELAVQSEEGAGEENGLPQVLSAQDVAEARAALEVQEPEPVVAVEPDSAGESEEDVDADIAPLAPPAAVEARVTGPIVPPVAETQSAVDAGRAVRDMAAGKDGDRPLTVVPSPHADAAEEESGSVVLARAVERESADGEGRPGIKDRPAVRRIEFDMPASLDPRAPLEVSHPSGGVPRLTASEAPRTDMIVPGSLRGVMGYRLPLISRQEVPDQIVSGVLIPAHTTYVILKEGAWELVDVTPEELQVLMDAAARRKAAATEAEPVRKGWNPLRIFRKRQARDDK